ncbi:hypothetical protein [Brevibacterium sp.]|uniref:hypothetical protein n=1 Tax=Brevibacterium sp. TaxID=1701 RepID=UPI00281227FC|nr:hypothetical protein [Brevibacterium sp.]
MIEGIRGRYNVVTYTDLRAAGVSTVEISRAKSCCLMVLSRGIYSIVAECSKPQHSRIRGFATDSEWVDYFRTTSVADRLRDRRFQQHVARLAVVHYPSYRTDDVVFGVSAALLHELPLFDVALRPITVAHSSASSVTGEIKRLRRPISVEDQAIVAGVRVITAIRTGLELISLESPSAGLAALDCVVRRTVVAKTGDKRLGARNPRLMFTKGREIVDAEFVPAALRLKRGKRLALKLLDIVSPLSESYAESRSSFNLHQLGLPDFVQQWNVVHEGSLLTRLDFLHKETKTALAIDGVGKYVEAGRGRLKRESYQHNTLLSMGFKVIHFSFSEVMHLPVFGLKLFEQVPELLKFRRSAFLK